MTSLYGLYNHDIILVLFKWIIKQDYKNKYLVTGDWSQSKSGAMDIVTDSREVMC